MAFAHLAGLDHAVIMVEDLAAAAETWGRLGFSVSPLGVHSAHVGAANHTVALDGDYIELLGILADTESNVIPRAFLDARGPGIERFALRCDDAGLAAVDLRAAGLDATGPFSFGRPVPLKGGGTTEARFRITRWPPEVRPAGVRIFACEHVTPEAVWQPDLQRHANTATHIRRMEIVSPAPERDAAAMATAIGSQMVPGTEGVFLVPSGGGRAALSFMTPAVFSGRYPAVPPAVIPDQGAMSLVIAVTDRLAALKALGPGLAQYSNDRLYVLPAAATGTVLAFEQA